MILLTSMEWLLNTSAMSNTWWYPKDNYWWKRCLVDDQLKDLQLLSPCIHCKLVWQSRISIGSMVHKSHGLLCSFSHLTFLPSDHLQSVYHKGMTSLPVISNLTPLILHDTVQVILLTIIIRLHRIYAYHIDGFLVIIDVAWLVCRLSAWNDRASNRNGSTNRGAAWDMDSDGPKEPCIRWGVWVSQGEGAILEWEMG